MLTKAQLKLLLARLHYPYPQLMWALQAHGYLMHYVFCVYTHLDELLRYTAVSS